MGNVPPQIQNLWLRPVAVIPTNPRNSSIAYSLALPYLIKEYTYKEEKDRMPSLRDVVGSHSHCSRDYIANLPCYQYHLESAGPTKKQGDEQQQHDPQEQLHQVTSPIYALNLLRL